MSGYRGNIKAKSRFTPGAAYLIQAGKMSQVNKAAILLKNIFQRQTSSCKVPVM